MFFGKVIATSIVISVAYTVIATLVFVAGYRAVRHSERALTLYAFVSMVLRMLSAAAVILVCLVAVNDNQWRRTFVIIFSAFYLLMLIFDMVFFIRSQKSKQQQNK